MRYRKRGTEIVVAAREQPDGTWQVTPPSGMTYACSASNFRERYTEEPDEVPVEVPPAPVVAVKVKRGRSKKL